MPQLDHKINPRHYQRPEWLPPESVSALILKQLAQDATMATGQPVREVTISVPAYFGVLERDATRNAGRIAGLDVIGVVPEPVAAALEYEIATRDATKTVLVYDLGGGTFDVTIMQVSAEAVEVVCTDRDQELGGVDWDDRLAHLLVDEFCRRVAVEDDLNSDDEFLQKIWVLAEVTKRHLSQVEAYTLELNYQGNLASVEVTRTSFQSATQDLLDRTFLCVDRAIENFGGKLSLADPMQCIEEVLLVGGSTRMPAVAEGILAHYGWQARSLDPDLAVAKGAARFALLRDRQDLELAIPESHLQTNSPSTQTHLESLPRLAARKVTTVLSRAFGIRVVDAKGVKGLADLESSSYVHHLIHAGERLPSGPLHLTAVTVVSSQTEISIEIFEQAGAVESPMLAANTLVETGLITGLTPLPAGSPVEITMSIDDEGFLSVHATEPRSGRRLTMDLRVGVLSEDQIQEAVTAVSAIAVRP